MGGGDLNLKKSWHPQTLHNIEKVWKAEQKADAEAKKIEQLRRELDEERQREEMQRYAIDQGIAKKKSDRLEWMYSAPGHSGVNREEYLLGKAIDKAVDPLATNDEKNGDAPGASFVGNDSPSASNDLATKIRDDPLFMIKKKENEKKKELLKNPVRMKQLQQMLKENLGKKGKKSKKDKKRKKEKRRKDSSDEDRKHKYRSKSSSHRRKEMQDSESSEDVERANLIHQNKERLQSRRDSEHNRDSAHHNHDRHKDSRKRKTYSSSSYKEVRLGKRNHEISSKAKEVQHKRSSSKSQSPSPKRKPARRSSPSPMKKQREDSTLNGHSKERRRHMLDNEERRRYRDRSRSPSPEKHRMGENSNSRSYIAKQGNSTVSRKITDEERERRLAEMMDNAKWRDEQRGKNVKRYKEEAEAEAKQTAQNTEKGASFVQPMKVQTFTSSTASVENRIKRNINSLQRTPAAMDKFLKK